MVRKKGKNSKECPWFHNERKHYYFMDYLWIPLLGSRTVPDDGILKGIGSFCLPRAHEEKQEVLAILLKGSPRMRERTPAKPE